MSIELKQNKEYSSSTSRYQVLRVVVEDEKYRYLETFNQVKIPEDSNDQYHVITQREVNRLDIISNNYYQSPEYWWAIALANNLIDPFVIEEGMVLRIPPLTSLSSYDNEILTRREGSL